MCQYPTANPRALLPMGGHCSDEKMLTLFYRLLRSLYPHVVDWTIAEKDIRLGIFGIEVALNHSSTGSQVAVQYPASPSSLMTKAALFGDGPEKCPKHPGGRFFDGTDEWIGRLPGTFQAADSTLKGERMRPMTVGVLVADQDVELALLYSRFLGSHGISAEPVADGLECMRRTRQRRPDVLVLDCELLWGGADGVVACLRE
jgi:hypothetical protein